MIFFNINLDFLDRKGIMHYINRKSIVLFLFIMLVQAVLICSGWAQYQLYRWANFETGKFQDGSVPIGGYFDTSVKVMDLARIPNMPTEFHTGISAHETGQYGLWLKGDPAIWMAGLADGVVLDRDKLGMQGRALYQADFYLPPVEQFLPSIAVLAMEPLPPGGKEPVSFYRFGLTKNVFLYFSHVVKDELQARIFKQDKTLLTKIPRPGWHRFAIVFEGVSTIRCYIDGQQPSFSPVEESTLRKLQVGIMLAETDATYDCFVDNLSIQWTPEDAPLPDSPYASSWGGGGVTQVQSTPQIPQAMASSQRPATLEWLEPNTGWERSKSSNTQMLVYFMAPRIPSTLKLDSLMQSSAEAQAFLGKCVPVKIDVNQLQGGHLAKKFRIFKVPTMVLLDPKGNETGRAIFRSTDDWNTFSAQFGQR